MDKLVGWITQFLISYTQIRLNRFLFELYYLFEIFSSQKGFSPLFFDVFGNKTETPPVFCISDEKKMSFYAIYVALCET